MRVCGEATGAGVVTDLGVVAKIAVSAGGTVAGSQAGRAANTFLLVATCDMSAFR